MTEWHPSYIVAHDIEGSGQQYRGKGAVEPGYHSVVYPDGSEVTRRNMNAPGAHVYRLNDEALGIAYANGRGDNRVPMTDAAKATIHNRISQWQQQYGITDPDVMTHHQAEVRFAGTGKEATRTGKQESEAAWLPDILGSGATAVASNNPPAASNPPADASSTPPAASPATAAQSQSMQPPNYRQGGEAIRSALDNEISGLRSAAMAKPTEPAMSAQPQQHAPFGAAKDNDPGPYSAHNMALAQANNETNSYVQQRAMLPQLMAGTPFKSPFVADQGGPYG